MYVGIDIGGTKTLVAKLSEHGEILDSRRFPTDHDYNQFLHDLAGQASELALETTHPCVVGVPGHLNREQGIVYALGNLPWINKPIAGDIARALGLNKVLIENDARLAGLSEAQLVKDQFAHVLFATVSTGIGGAYIENGRISAPLRDMEMGKMPLQFKGEYVQWEEFGGGRALTERYHRMAFEIAADDPAWRQVGEYVGYGLAAACSILQPDVIILGGSVGKQADKFKHYVAEFLDMHLHAIITRPIIMTAGRADDAVIYGCYDLAKQTYGDA